MRTPADWEGPFMDSIRDAIKRIPQAQKPSRDTAVTLLLGCAAAILAGRDTAEQFAKDKICYMTTAGFNAMESAGKAYNENENN